MKWSPQQDGALKAASAWLRDPKGPQIFRIFGFAGTGKTTLVKELAGEVSGPVLYATFTGKAALVLRKKGCPGASTIHSMIYTPAGEEETGEAKFILNPVSPAAYAKLIVIDEVSMVGNELASDLLSFGTRVLVLGDPFQLPPVSGEGYFINADPDVMLTEVHRQAEDSPIIRMSMDVREGRGLQVGQYGDSRVICRRDVDRDQMRDLVLSADQVLCGLNKTRHGFNARIRELRGRAGIASQSHPVAGDRLVCLRNSQQKGLLNGGLWDVATSSAKSGNVQMIVTSVDLPEMPPVKVKVPEEFFDGTEKSLTWDVLKKVEQFTYGYALTVHKSQGSQWDNVVVFDESRVFRDDAAKHLYTAVTRAAERITVVA